PSDDKRPNHCVPCRDTAHQAFATNRDEDHRSRWAAHHKAIVEHLEGIITDLREKLADPEALVREANERADAAYRSRDRAIRSLSYVEERHHSADAKMCVCGTTKEKCTEFQATYVVADLIRTWEARNRDRMRQDKDHQLP